MLNEASSTIMWWVRSDERCLRGPNSASPSWAQYPSAQSVTAIPSATSMTFVDENGATIQYQLSGAVINRTIGGVTTPLIGGVQTFALTYFSAYDGSTNTGTTTGVAGSVTLVRLQLVTGTERSVATYSAANQKATVEMLVRLRNM